MSHGWPGIEEFSVKFPDLHGAMDDAGITGSAFANMAAIVTQVSYPGDPWEDFLGDRFSILEQFDTWINANYP